jgi:hypothetical protein
MRPAGREREERLMGVRPLIRLDPGSPAVFKHIYPK